MVLSRNYIYNTITFSKAYNKQSQLEQYEYIILYNKSYHTAQNRPD